MRAAVLAALATAMVACSPPVSRVNAPAPADAPAPPQIRVSSGELRVAEPFLPQDLDADTGPSAFILQGMGISESLMRFTPDLKVEPWLAEKLELVDANQWKVSLRTDATFSDGTPVDGAATKASLERSLEKQPSLVDLIPKGTELTADGRTLTIKTPVPIALMPNNLASANLTIKKVLSSGDIVYTGPFVVAEFVARDTLNVVANEKYRGGPPRLKAIKARQVADTNARALALQAGDVDISQALLPSDVSRLKAASLETFAVPWARQHMMVINTRQTPVDDRNVRKALALAIDREALVNGVLDGVGAPAYGIAPEGIGLTGVVRTQRYDPAAARQALDAAGWVPAADGIRAKDGKRLAINLGTYPGRAELEQFAVVMQDQLKTAGIETSIEKFADVEVALANNTFTTTTYSIGSAAFADLSRLLATLYVPSPRNTDRYANPQVTDLYSRFIVTADTSQRETLLHQMQELISEDTPIVHLVNPYQVVGASPKVKGFAPHPLDQYKYHAEVFLQG